MLKFGLEYSFNIFDKYSRNDDPNLLWLIYVYNSVVQTLWLASADKTNKYFELKNSWGADGAPQTRTTC